MPRSDPPAPPETLERKPQLIQVRDYSLITPLFGGGVVPGFADPVSVVRATAIRGQLRFWWRAMRAGQFRSSAAMKEVEDLLWGAASTPNHPRSSLIQVQVLNVRAGRPVIATDRNGQTTNRHGEPIRIGEPISRDSYAAFPLNDKPDAVVREQVGFSIQLSFPETWPQRKDMPKLQGTPADELAAALWAWESFGGIGARTRRGFGAVHCTSIDGKANPQLCPSTNPEQVTQWLIEQIMSYTTGTQWPEHVPHVSAATSMRIIEGRKQPLDTWRYLIEQLKNFRQQRNRGERTPFGRSRWPEADELRRITRRSLPTHSTPISSVRKFPRAAFGLPLIIQFKRDQWARGNQDGEPPGNNTIKGKLPNGDIVERWASPLILKPLATQNGHVGLALVLEGSSMPQLVLETGRGQYTPVEGQLSQEEAKQLLRSDHRTLLLGGETDVIKAFLNIL